LIPGTFADARNFVAAVRELDPAYELLILEHRGIGGSWPPPVSSSIESCAKDAIDVLDALGVQTCYVGGHSLGGMIAIELGRQIPERLRGIFSIEGWTSSQAAADAFQSDMKSTLSPEQQAKMLEYRIDVLHRWTPQQRQMFGTIWKQWNGEQILRTTSLPVLELYGDRRRSCSEFHSGTTFSWSGSPEHRIRCWTSARTK
jgi:pimeloyl-ACP methyl ester carboxylesterase